MHKLAKSVLGYIRKHDLLRAGDRVGVAVSAGADSVALLRILLGLRRELGIVLTVVHLNHRLRGADSDADGQFVGELAAAHDLRFISESRDVKAYAAEKKLSLETAAREVRYKFFTEVLESREADKIATAHTLDDQAETVLLKLARGAGTRGLAGIYPDIALSTQQSALGREQSAVSIQHSVTQPAAAIIRPLLWIKRSDVESYLAEIGQAWREDSSNRELRHTRNRIRHEILPQLGKMVNPEVREILAEAAEIARGEEEFWAGEMARILPQMWSRRGRGGVLDRERLRNLELAEQRRVLRAAAESLGLNLAFQHVETVLDLSTEGAAAPLPQGWEAVCRKGDIRFEPATHPVADYEYSLQMPGKTAVPEAEIILEAIVVGPEGCARKDSQCFLHVDPTSSRLIIRNWRAGDRFWPAHAKEPKKIKELLQDRHITGQEKRLWPVIAIGEEVVWVCGFGVRRDFQSKNGTGVLIQDSPMTK